MAESKPTSVTEVLPVSNKITDHKLNWTNYSDWIKIIRMHLLSIEKEGHLTELPSKNDPKMTWLEQMPGSSYKFRIPLRAIFFLRFVIATQLKSSIGLSSKVVP
ncbi:hypothetical protein QN277_011161 [Acacia crassicarpa]|uniref:Uncharacterized protein n=1 Tax=Acacia crassicarpa TaxID=499986 RepID=A0AAE1MY35_9FABA|nr:hypothetical protein QN277_011161 [Acacia crassicarpa]